MRDRRIRVGMLLGLAAAAAFTVELGRWPSSTPGQFLPDHGSVLSDCDGAIEQIVIQYVGEAAGIVATVYREFLGQLAEDVTVLVVCPGEDDFDDFRARVGTPACRLVPVFTGHAMTCWARDRWLALGPAGTGGPALLLSPREESAGDIWPARKGDERIAGDLAAALGGGVRAHRSVLAFDGGDFVADADRAFVTPRVGERSIGGEIVSTEQLRRALAGSLRRKVIVLSEAPPHHAGMFMMLAGGRTALVGDPSLAQGLLVDVPASCLPQNPDFSDEIRRRFDAVAGQCAASGYRVVRVPVVPGRDGRTYLTCLNVIIDRRAGCRIVYMPVYRGVEALNAAGAAAWRGLGYEVRPVDCTDTFRHFGSLRCLVNVLRRSPATAARSDVDFAVVP